LLAQVHWRREAAGWAGNVPVAVRPCGCERSERSADLAEPRKTEGLEGKRSRDGATEGSQEP
jgi:hypothetical protein